MMSSSKASKGKTRPHKENTRYIPWYTSLQQPTAADGMLVGWPPPAATRGCVKSVCMRMRACVCVCKGDRNRNYGKGVPLKTDDVVIFCCLATRGNKACFLDWCEVTLQFSQPSLGLGIGLWYPALPSSKFRYLQNKKRLISPASVRQ